MKNLYIIFIISIYAFPVVAQPQFKKMYGAFSIFNFELLEIKNSNQFLISNHNNINTDHTFFKIDKNGEPYDQAYIYQSSGGSTFGSHNYFFRNDSIYDLIGLNATAGTYPVVCFIARRDSSLQNSLLMKYYSYRPSGPGISSTMNHDSTYTIAGGYAIAPGQYYPMLFKLDIGLNVSWSTSYQDRVGYVQKIIQAPDSGYYLLMHLVSEGMALAKTDSLGIIQWCHNFSNPYRYANGVVLLPSGQLLMYGYMNPGNSSGYSSIEAFVTKVDSAGTIIWSQKLGDANFQFYRMGVEPDMYLDTISENRVVMCGIIRPISKTYNDMVMLVMDSAGYIEWARCYGNDYFDEAGTIVHQTSDGGFILGGFNNYQINNFPPVYNTANVTIIKTDSLGVSDGCMEYPVTIFSQADTPSVTSLTWSIYVDSLVTEIPSNMVDTTGTPTRNENMCTFVSLMEKDNPGNFMELFPNPTRGQFTITARTAISKVTVYDITGRRIFDQVLPGLLNYAVDIEGELAGLYLVQVTIGDKVMTRKIAVE